MWVGRWALVYAQSRTFLGQLASQIFDPSMEPSQLSWNKSPLLQLVLLLGWPVVELLVKVVDKHLGQRLTRRRSTASSLALCASARSFSEAAILNMRRENCVCSTLVKASLLLHTLQYLRTW